MIKRRTRLRVKAALCAAVLLFSAVMSASAAAGTKYESESNNTYTTANRTVNDYDSFGKISTAGDIDYWVVRFTKGGSANFYLGNIPTGCNYDLRIYDSNGTTLLRSSANSGNSHELITMTVSSGRDYYIRINSASGASTAYYLFRTKVYPSNTIASVPLYQQQSGSTCGSACGRMILRHYGVGVTETAFKDRAQFEADDGDDYTYVYAIVKAINHYLRNAGITRQFKYRNISSDTLSEYTTLVLINILYNHPVQVVMSVNSTAYFPYTTGGHYVVIKGMQYSASGGSYTAVVNDPHYAYCNTYNVPISAIRSYNIAHSGFIIYSEGSGEASGGAPNCYS